MRGGEKLSLEQIQEILKASEELAFAGESKEEVYVWIETTMGAQHGRRLRFGRADGGGVGGVGEGG